MVCVTTKKYLAALILRLATTLPRQLLTTVLVNTHGKKIATAAAPKKMHAAYAEVTARPALVAPILWHGTTMVRPFSMTGHVVLSILFQLPRVNLNAQVTVMEMAFATT